VVHVESASRPDVLRLAPPFKDGVPGIDRSQFMANFNSSKLGLALNFAKPEAVKLALRLVDWADVVVESFTPGTLERRGLDYAALSRTRPDLVMLSTCLRGQTGPERTYAGFGLQGACLAGLHLITGWPDRPPAGTWGAYTDFINPRFGLGSIAAALRYRARTGRGQHIDLSQTEAAINFVAPLLLDFTVNGRPARATGHDSRYACPHGVFQTAGVQRYIAVAVETEDQWAALKGVAPLERWSKSAYDRLEARLPEKVAIEDALRVWALPQEPLQLVDCLARAGVPAALVQRPSDLYEDPQLKHREFFVTLDHSVMGLTPYDGLATRFSATPGRLRKAAPCLGEDTHLVLSEILGLADEDIAALAAAGALE
jgi:benzylsuccinate CoA-transferase BbsF subunit